MPLRAPLGRALIGMKRHDFNEKYARPGRRPSVDAPRGARVSGRGRARVAQDAGLRRALDYDMLPATTPCLRQLLASTSSPTYCDFAGECHSRMMRWGASDAMRATPPRAKLDAYHRAIIRPHRDFPAPPRLRHGREAGTLSTMPIWAPQLSARCGRILPMRHAAR